MQKVTVVLPTYNEAKNLPLMIDALLSLPVKDLHIMVVDDNSPDGTGTLADALAERHPDSIEVMHRQSKAGLGAAYIAGFKKAIRGGADYIIQMDCDFSHQPKYIPDMIAAAETNDLVLASRYIKGGSVDESWSLFRKGLSWFANRIYVPTLLNMPIYDATGGYRLWRAQTLIGLDLDRVWSRGYVFQVEMAYMTYQLGFKVTEIPIHFPDRQLGESKMSFKVQVEAATRVWQLVQRHHSLKPEMRSTVIPT
ncbi:MAG: polyprenol monophosphomannose synthase [Chloroflexota bacterium]